QELFIRWQPSRGTNGSHPGELNQQLPPAPGGSPVVSHAAVDEPAPDENERITRLVARSVEDSSPGSNGKPQHRSARAALTCASRIAHLIVEGTDARKGSKIVRWSLPIQ